MTTEALKQVLKWLKESKKALIYINTKSGTQYVTTIRCFIECNDGYEIMSNPPIMILQDDYTTFINLSDIESIML